MTRMSKDLGMKDEEEHYTENDAVHPRFMEALTAEQIEECQRHMYYYCDYCKLYFGATNEGLKYHFKGDIVQHPPYASCFYCSGPVYNYKYRSENYPYHNCVKKK